MIVEPCNTVHATLPPLVKKIYEKLNHIELFLEAYKAFPLKPKKQKYLMVLHTVYDQQKQMHDIRTKRIDDRIVNNHMYAAL